MVADGNVSLRRRRSRRCLLWVALLVWIVPHSPIGGSALGNVGLRWVDFVRDGDPLGVYEPDQPWIRGDRFMEGTGARALLLADHDLGSGDFEIRAVLSITQLPGSGAYFELGGSKVIFDGAEGQISTVGIPKGEKETAHGESARTIISGKPFEFRLVREGPRFRFWIGKTEIAELKVKKLAYGRFGFHPGKSKMRLVSFRASGDVRDVDRRVRIDPTEFANLANEERIDRAIESGIEFLIANIKGQQEAYGAGNHGPNVAGAVALETYALIVAGLPIDDPVIEANFDYLDRYVIKPGRSYDLACFIFAHDAAIAQLEHDVLLTARAIDPRSLTSLGKRHRKSMKSGLTRLLEGQIEGGAWRYDTRSEDFDHSCTQFAALGLGVAAHRGIQIPDHVWIRLARHLVAHQQETGPETDRRGTLEKEERPEFTWSRAEREKREKRERRGGQKGGSGSGGNSVKEEIIPDPYVGDESITIHARGWAYAAKATDKATWNMTSSGISSLMLVYAHGGHALDPDLRLQVSKSIRDGIGWQLENWTPHSSLYSLYSLEKVADIGGIELFDDRDWYEDSCSWLLSSQLKDGSWKSGGTGEIPRISTAFALLILRRATTLLTRNPADEIIFTGPGSRDASSKESRVWIYVTRLDRAVSFPGLLRTLRLRPAVPLLKLLEEVCSEYPVDQVPEVIPALLEVRGRIRGRGPVALLDRCLALATGRKLSGDDAYRAWHETWCEVVALEDEKLGNPAGRLEEIYRASAIDNRVLRKIIPILIRLRARGSLATLLPDLDHKDVAIRVLVYRAVQSFHKESPPPFHALAPGAERRDQAEAVRAWVRARAGARAPGGGGG